MYDVMGGRKLIFFKNIPPYKPHTVHTSNEAKLVCLRYIDMVQSFAQILGGKAVMVCSKFVFWEYLDTNSKNIQSSLGADPA